MKYLLSALFIIVSAGSYAGEFEDMCLKIGYNAGSSKFDACVKKLQARKKPLNNVSDSQLAKTSPFNVEKAIGEAVIQYGIQELATKGLGNKKVKELAKKSSSNGSSSLAKKPYPGPGPDVTGTGNRFLNMKVLGIIK